MKKLFVAPVLCVLALAILSFPSCEKEPVDVLVDQLELDQREVDCDMDSNVFENASDEKVTVKIEITDNCEGGGTDDQASEVEKVDDIGSTVKSVTLEDEKTKVISWTVNPDEAIRVKCRGADGGCQYKLILIE